MRRSVEADALPGGFEDRGDEGGGRAFAFGSGEMNHAIGAVGMAEALEQQAHAGDAKRAVVRRHFPRRRRLEREEFRAGV